MLIKLPIIEDNKIIVNLYKLYKKNDYIYLSPIEKNNKDTIKINIALSDNIVTYENNIENIKVICCNNVNGINYLTLSLPLKFKIVDNFLISIHFMQFSFLSNYNNSNIDFIKLLNDILLIHFNYQILPYEYFKKYENDIWEYINNELNLNLSITHFNDILQYTKNIWDYINIIVNSSIFCLYNLKNINLKKLKDYNKNINIHKKIINTIITIKSFKFSIYFSNKYTFWEHLTNFNKKHIKYNEIEVDNKYYIEINENKFMLINIINKNDNKLYCDNLITLESDRYKFYFYPPNSEFKINNLVINLLNTKEIFYDIASKSKFKISNNFINYFFDCPINSHLYDDSFNVEFDIIKSNSYTKDFFKYVVNKYKNDTTNTINIFKILFSNYNYPIKFNKNELDDNFDDIIYISLFHLNYILNIDNNVLRDKNKVFLRTEINVLVPSKIKLLYFNILKTFYLLINGITNDDIFSVKYFQDIIHKNFIKIFFGGNHESFKYLKSLTKDDSIILNVKNTIRMNFLLIDIINRINWNNLCNRLGHLNILMDNNKYIFYKDKFNKIIFPDNFDNKIKSIIINPFEMFKYLKKENDYYKWLKFLGIKCFDLYCIQKSLSSDDFLNLSKIIFSLINVKEQNLKDDTYSRFINYCNKYPKLIMDNNNRINLKIKEYFSYGSCNINLGILAKHININQLNYVSLPNDEIEDQVIKLENKLNIITQKYLKYKKKYLMIKNNQFDFVSNISNTSY